MKILFIWVVVISSVTICCGPLVLVLMGQVNSICVMFTQCFCLTTMFVVSVLGFIAISEFNIGYDLNSVALTNMDYEECILQSGNGLKSKFP